MSKKTKVLYSAIVLTEESHDKLVRIFSDVIPDEWDMFAHHMTFAFKEPLPDELREFEGEETTIYATHFGKTSKVCAVSVEGDHTSFSNNPIPHITVGVNKREGGSPVMSNDITDWSELDPHIELTGVIKEITNKD